MPIDREVTMNQIECWTPMRKFMCVRAHFPLFCSFHQFLVSGAQAGEGGDFNERALKHMMGGKLEMDRDGNKMAELKRPEWMHGERSAMTEDQLKQIKEFEVKEKAFLEELEVQKKSLAAELKKLKGEAADCVARFDDAFARFQMEQLLARVSQQRRAQGTRTVRRARVGGAETVRAEVDCKPFVGWADSVRAEVVRRSCGQASNSFCGWRLRDCVSSSGCGSSHAVRTRRGCDKCEAD